MSQSKSADPTPTDAPKAQLSTEEFIEKLRRALKRDGDFPASAKIVTELRQLVGNPKTTANQITEVILREPSLGTRVLHIVNSSFYRRAQPIMTVSQAVIQIGMKTLSELCAGLVLLQRFVPAARRDGAFANCLRKTIVTSLLSSSITSEVGRNSAGKTDECGYLAGSFAELGTLLLAFYFPQIYDAALKRSETKKQNVDQSIREIVGLSPLELSIEVLDSLHLPDFYLEALKASASQVAAKDGTSPTVPIVTSKRIPSEKEAASNVGRALYAARTISDTLVSGKEKAQLDTVLDSLKDALGLDLDALNDIVGELPAAFNDHCTSIELSLPALPQYISAYSNDAGAAEQNQDTFQQNFDQFILEIRSSIDNREPTASVITSVMETFAWALKFERVLLLLVAPGKTKLIGRMLLGNIPNFDPKKLSRSLGPDAPPGAPDIAAFRESRPVFTGNPVLEGGQVFAAIPIGFKQNTIGVIYADRVTAGPKELNANEQQAAATLAELLERSVTGNL